VEKKKTEIINLTPRMFEELLYDGGPPPIPIGNSNGHTTPCIIPQQ